MKQIKSLAKIKKELNILRNPEKARFLGRFFQTGRAGYGEGDIFLGITVPRQRQVAKKYVNLSLAPLQQLLDSKYHEYRLTALFILTAQYRRSDRDGRKTIAKFYLCNRRRINNWDLVDLSAPNILGDFLLDRDRKIIYRLARSSFLWDRRIAVLTTFAFIRAGQFTDALKIAVLLINDSHDLIHKAVGWMLREVGKRDVKVEKEFLGKYGPRLPRTMLRYAIEKFPENERQKYLKQKAVK